ncbi:hypothetical protein [Streptomyces syringium]|uniref:hypothetical protein n=1 Tax=Streptomyces syringium TaxID=76729 RepID=UPI0034170AD8
MFDTPQALHQALTTSGTWYDLYAALHASNPLLVTRAHEDHKLVGLRFEEHTFRQHRTTGTITIDPATGALTVYADTITGERWFTALDSLGAVGAHEDAPPANPKASAWSWQPGPRQWPGLLRGTLHSEHLTACTLIERRTGDAMTYANAEFTMTPATRAACPAAWALAAAFFHQVATGTPAGEEPEQISPN